MEYNWIWVASDVHLNVDGLKDVVYNIHWRRTLKDGDLVVEVYGTCPVGDPNPESFTDYENLKDPEVFAWLEETLDVESIDAGLTAQMDEKKNPVNATLPPPTLES